MKRLFTIFILVFIALQSKAQYNIIATDHKETKETLFQTVRGNSSYSGRSYVERKWTLGGSFGFSFGDYTSIDISPQVGYKWTDYLTTGVGISYNYFYESGRYKMNYLGGNIFGRVTPVRYIALQVQPELMGMWGKYYGDKIDSKTVPTLLIGAGGYIPSGVGALSIMFYYDVIQDKYSPYGDNWICSVGYVFNF